MADAQSLAKYNAKQLKTSDKIKKKGQKVEFKAFVETGPEWDRVQTPVLFIHYALPLKLEDSDIKGNVKSSNNKWMVTALHEVADKWAGANEVKTSMKLVVSGVVQDISHVVPLKFDGINIILYEVFSQR